MSCPMISQSKAGGASGSFGVRRFSCLLAYRDIVDLL